MVFDIISLSQSKSSSSDRVILASAWRNWPCATAARNSCPKVTASFVIGSINNTLTVGVSFVRFLVAVSAWNRSRKFSNKWCINKNFNMYSFVVFGRKCLTRSAAVRMTSLWHPSGPWVQCTPKDPEVTACQTKCWCDRQTWLCEYLPVPPVSRSSSVSSVEDTGPVCFGHVLSFRLNRLGCGYFSALRKCLRKRLL